MKVFVHTLGGSRGPDCPHSMPHPPTPRSLPPQTPASRRRARFGLVGWTRSTWRGPRRAPRRRWWRPSRCLQRKSARGASRRTCCERGVKRESCRGGAGPGCCSLFSQVTPAPPVIPSVSSTPRAAAVKFLLLSFACPTPSLIGTVHVQIRVSGQRSAGVPHLPSPASNAVRILSFPPIYASCACWLLCEGTGVL